MKKRTFKNKLVSIIAAAAMLFGTMPVFASSSYTISLTTLPGYYSKDNPGGYDLAYNFTPAGNGCLAMQITKEQVEADVKPHVEYALNVEKSGAYDLNFKSSRLVNNTYTSPATVTIDGKVLDGILETKSYDENIKEYNTTVVLEKGAHTIRFTVTGNRNKGGEAGLFYLYYINLTPTIDKTISDKGEYIIEAQNYDAGTHALTELKSDKTTAAYGGSYYYPGGTKGSQVGYTYSLCVDKAGKYDMTVFAGDYQNWLGRFEVLVNGTVVGDMRNGTGSFCTYKRAVAAYNDTWYIREHNPIEVDLNKGANTVVIRSYEGGPGNTNWSFAFDCIKFTKAFTDSLKFDNNAGSTPGNQYYGGTVHQMFTSETEAFTLDVPAGEYNLYAAASCSVFTSYLGTLGFAVGDADMTDFTSANVTQGTKYNDIGGDFKYNGTLNLTGNETITFKTTATAVSAANNNYTLFDYFELVPVNPVFGNADITIAETTLAKGEQTTATSALYYDNGCTASDRLISSVAYSSSDNTVVKVNDAGEVVAKNPGVATVTVTYTCTDGTTVTATEDVTVYGEDGIIPVSLTYDAETKTATVKLTTLSDESKTAAIILGGYATENGTASKFTDIFSASKEITRGRVSTISHEINGDSIRAFIWNSLEGMKPIRDDIKVK